MEMEIVCNPSSLGNVLPMALPHFKDMKKPTMSQTFQYLNKIISCKTAQEFENLSELVSSNIPLTLFENSLQLILIDSLHLENEVSKILLSQNDYQIKRVLGCKWFFQNLPFEYCANQLFPYISVSLRCKIINKLSKHLRNTEEAEKYFTFIRNNYDKERAEYLLPKCSPEFILNYVEKVNPTFEHNNGLRIFLNICKRHEKVGIHILSSIFDMKKERCHELNKYNKILSYFASYHPDSAVSFLKKYCSYMPSEIFGKKLTKKLKSKVKDHLFTDFMKNLIFKEKHLFQILTFEEKIKMIAGIVIYKFKELTFYSWRESNNRLSNLMKLVPANDRLSMVDSAFKAVYNLNYNDYANCWSSEILELVPIKSRQPYVIKLEKILETEVFDRDEIERDVTFDIEYSEKLIYLYDSSTAFEKFKKIILKTPSLTKRESILFYMVKNCSINNDTKILEEVVDFIVVHHRNDDPYVIYKIIDLICTHFPASSLNLNMFKNFEDLIHFFILKRYDNYDVCDLVREKHMYYLLENNINVDSHVENFFKSVLPERGYVKAFVKDFKSKYSKTLVLSFLEKAVQYFPNKSTTGDWRRSSSAEIDNFLKGLLDTFRYYNEWNKRNPIFLRDIPGLEEILRENLTEKFSDVGAEDWPLYVWEKYSFDVMKYHKLTCLFHILKQNPNIIDRHFAGVLTILFSSTSAKYKSSKKNIENFMMAASFFEKVDKVKEFTLNEFKNGDSIKIRENALKFYSCICTIEEFKEVIEKYLPKQEKIKKQSKDDFDTIQILIPSLIKNVRPRWKNLELSLKFFFGDFRKIVLPSFWACCYYTRYDYVIPFLKEHLDKVSQKISYRKDIIRLIIELSDRKGKCSFLLKCWDEYKHYSVRSNLLLHISKNFLEEQSNKSFQVLEHCILDCDPLVIESRPDLKKIPKVFWNDYVSALWRFSENQKNPFRNKFRETVLSCFNRDNINLLSPEFCESIIKNNLFSSSSELKVGNFTVLYLFVNSNALEWRVRMVFDLIKDRKPSARSIHDFINILILESLNNPKNLAELFKSFLENWPEYSNGVLFEERTLLTYYFLYHKVLKRCSDSNRVSVEFGKELKIWYSSVDSLSDLLFIYAKALSNFFSNFKTFRAVLVVRELIEGSQDRNLAVLAILSIPMEAVIWHNKEGKIFDKIIIESKKVLNDIVKTLENYNDRIVEIYLRWKFDFVK